MSQMLDHEKINKILSEFHRPEMLIGIKVTTEFANCLKTMAITETINDSLMKRCGYYAHFTGVPVEIDDDIDGHYELVFNKENDNV